MAPIRTRIADLKHRVAICKMNDVVLDGATMVLRREAVVWTWASIEHQQHMSSFLAASGYATQENPARPTHRIRVRYGLELDYTAAAWVYEEFRKSSPRWYKVVGFVDEDSNHVMLECHLVERNETAKPTSGALAPAKQDVVL